MSLHVTHFPQDRIRLTYDGKPLFDYVYVSTVDPFEAPRPYFAPLYTLAGDDVTLFRPHDHPWHVGLSMTWTYINEQNLWGGNTYVHGEGYQPLDNVGATRHLEWHQLAGEGEKATLDHTLAWVTSFGETWLHERRVIIVDTHQASLGVWSLQLAMRFENVSGKRLQIDSPLTRGLPNIGYGGLFWRGPRSFHYGELFAANGERSETMVGKPNPWIAFCGQHDGSNHYSTLIFIDDPHNDRYPTRWWARNEQYAGVSSSFVYDEPFVFKPGQTLALSYRVWVCNGKHNHAEVNALLTVLSSSL